MHNASLVKEEQVKALQAVPDASHPKSAHTSIGAPMQVSVLNLSHLFVDAFNQQKYSSLIKLLLQPVVGKVEQSATAV